MRTFQDYLESVKRNNPDMVGRKITIHWDSLERLLADAYRRGNSDGEDPILRPGGSMPDFMKGFFR